MIARGDVSQSRVGISLTYYRCCSGDYPVTQLQHGAHVKILLGA